ncbi:murein hydrolase activator EnvC [Bacteroides sp. 224]|uniref:murein hydrolase activator EnvC family protein n=1 Tax=Bacteroides sp. 224 TaxID=2302936 RepID=UPI0013D0C954|nr:peptidoglycan DD-metalloendopeptidase family protein [Bacteroides sp. 224]NDV64221.1 peptidase M23 [Bacteroides sp. 224]
MKKFLFLLVILICSISLSAQTNDLIKELESRRVALHKQIQDSEMLLTTTQKDVTGQLNTLATLTGQINERKRYIQVVTNDIEAINRETNSLEKQLKKLELDLTDKKQKYEASVQYLRKNRTVEEKLLFIFSAKSLGQTYRRLRYVNEYATYQRLQGEELLVKQEEVNKKKKELLATKKAKENLLKERERERKRLEEQEKQQRALVVNLRKKQKGLQAELTRKQREARQLNDRVDKLIAEEIERVRKLAENEARKEAEEARKKAIAAGEKVPATAKVAPMGSFTMNKADRELSGSFANNQGKLPVPVTGPYTILGNYGQYKVDGLGGVELDKKGIDIQAKPGAEARAIFNGEISGVFQLRGKILYNILIRHGNYISVYFNISKPTVKQGDKVKTGATLGKIFSDSRDNNRTVLHFQLRKEREQLNPKLWLNR